MRKTIFCFLATFATFALFTTSCENNEQTVDEAYKDWREYNQQWMTEQSLLKNSDGTSYYTTVVSPSDPDAFILYHPVGEVHTDALTPLFTSTTKVNYTLRLANDSVINKGTGFVSQLNSTGLINGWSLALMQMHVGDSARIVIPYSQGYGTSGNGTLVPPYSNLLYDIKLVDIPGYEIRP